MRSRRFVASLALAALAPACGGGAPVARGFGSHQVLSMRVSEDLYFEGSRGDVVLYSIGPFPAASTFWSIDLATGAVTEDDGSYADIPTPIYTYPTDPTARYHCSDGADASGAIEFWIDDQQTGQRVAISGVELALGCPTDADPTLKVWRRDGKGYLTLWTGRYDNLQMAPVDLAIIRIVGRVAPTDAAVQVLGGPTRASALGIYAIDLTTFAVSEVVPPAVTGAPWADGATPIGSTDSTSLQQDPHSLGGGVIPIGDHFGYWRLMNDNSATFFVGPLASGPAREVAVFHIPATPPELITVSAAEGTPAPGAPLPIVWQRWDDANQTSDIMIWDDARQRLLTCAPAFQSPATAVVSADRTQLALSVLQGQNQTSHPLHWIGPLQLVDLTSPAGGAAACTTPIDANVGVAGLSPDGSASFWLIQTSPDGTNSELWTAAPDGSAPRLAGKDTIEGWPQLPHFVGPSRIELDINADLLWIDAHDDPIVTHAIVEDVQGAAIDRGRWLIVGYDASTQDGTARLGIVDRDSGDKRLISPEVVSFFSPDIPSTQGFGVIPSPFRAADDPIRIVYLVRGRNPSPQDGLWVATINASDIP